MWGSVPRLVDEVIGEEPPAPKSKKTASKKAKLRGSKPAGDEQEHVPLAEPSLPEDLTHFEESSKMAKKKKKGTKRSKENL